MNINIDNILKEKIKVIFVGNKALGLLNIINNQNYNIEILAIDIENSILDELSIENKILLGKTLQKEHFTDKFFLGENAAIESFDEIKSKIDKSSILLFISDVSCEILEGALSVILNAANELSVFKILINLNIEKIDSIEHKLLNFNTIVCQTRNTNDVLDIISILDNSNIQFNNIKSILKPRSFSIIKRILTKGENRISLICNSIEEDIEIYSVYNNFNSVILCINTNSNKKLNFDELEMIMSVFQKNNFDILSFDDYTDDTLIKDEIRLDFVIS